MVSSSRRLLPPEATRVSRAEFLRTGGRFALAAAAGSALPLGVFAQAPSAPVLRRPIPSSGEMLPVIGSGTAVIFDIDPQHAKIPALADSMRALLAGGGAMIDTAPTYGQAEKRLGEVLRQIEPALRERAFIATKISTTGEQSGIDQVNRSFADIGVSRFDLLQVHNVRDTETHLRTIRRLRDEGRVRYVGITTSFEKTHEEYLRVMRTEKLDFVQIDYALDNRLAEERILPLAQDRGMAVIVNLPFGRGRLFSKARGKPLPPFAPEIDCTSWAQFFIKFLLAHPAVTVIIPGTDRPEYALDNLNAARGRIPDAKMRQQMLDYWERLG